MTDIDGFQALRAIELGALVLGFIIGILSLGSNRIMLKVAGSLLFLGFILYVVGLVFTYHL